METPEMQLEGNKLWKFNIWRLISEWSVKIQAKNTLTTRDLLLPICDCCCN